MKLDDFENKDAYLSKEKEINKKIGMLKNEIKEYESLKTLNNNIQKQISTIESILNSPNTIKEFDENIFNNLVEKIIVGEKCEDKSINSNVVRFILKIGTDYVYDINDDKSVSFRTNNLEKLPWFKDERVYNNKTIYFYKLAQLLTSDILHIRECLDNIKVNYSNLIGCAITKFHKHYVHLVL